MLATPVVLGGQRVLFREPVFGELRRILPAYQALAAPEMKPEQRRDALQALFAGFPEHARRLRRLRGGDLAAFLAAIPAICGLEPAAEGHAGADPWGDLYAHLSASFGWDYDYIDRHMTSSRAKEYRGYLAKNPPTHQLVAAFLGYEHQTPNTGNPFLAAIAAKAKAAQAMNRP